MSFLNNIENLLSLTIPEFLVYMVALLGAKLS
jgi:hypothetical protein